MRALTALTLLLVGRWASGQTCGAGRYNPDSGVHGLFGCSTGGRRTDLSPVEPPGSLFLPAGACSNCELECLACEAGRYKPDYLHMLSMCLVASPGFEPNADNTDQIKCTVSRRRDPRAPSSPADARARGGCTGPRFACP